jgi:hypothetical protein
LMVPTLGIPSLIWAFLRGPAQIIAIVNRAFHAMFRRLIGRPAL